MKPETRKEEIIATAAELFKDRGYSAVTMRDIARSMGIRAASLYNHINSKQEILIMIILSLAEEFTKGMAAIKSSEATCLLKLRQIVHLHVTIAGNNPNGMACLNNDWMHLEDQLAYYLSLRSNYEDDFRNILKEGIAVHEIAEINAEIMLFSMLSTLRLLYLWIPKKEEVDTEKLASDLSRVLINGIMA